MAVNNKGVPTKMKGLSNITNSTASPIIRPNCKSVNQRSMSPSAVNELPMSPLHLEHHHSCCGNFAFVLDG